MFHLKSFLESRPDALKEKSERGIPTFISLLSQYFSTAAIIRLDRAKLFAKVLKMCTKNMDCLTCIQSECVYVEFENWTSGCYNSAKEVKGIRRRQFTVGCPRDLFPESLRKFAKEGEDILTQEYFGYQLYLYITLPIIFLVMMFLVFKAYRCFYHRYRYHPGIMRANGVNNRRYRFDDAGEDEVHFQRVNGAPLALLYNPAIPQPNNRQPPQVQINNIEAVNDRVLRPRAGIARRLCPFC